MRKKIKNYKKWLGLCVIVSAVLFAQTVHAESLVNLQSGSTFKGTLLREEGDLYFFNVSGMELSIKKSLVTSIIPIEGSSEESTETNTQEAADKKEPSSTTETDSEEPKKEAPGQASEEKPEEKHLGSISGTIVLPEVEEKGKLCVWFISMEAEDKNAVPQKYFQVFEPEEIKGLKVPFLIRDIPAGKYKGLACWDVATPQWKESWGEGNFVPLPGDYTGGTLDPITVTADQKTEDILIETTFFLKQAEVTNEDKNED